VDGRLRRVGDLAAQPAVLDGHFLDRPVLLGQRPAHLLDQARRRGPAPLGLRTPAGLGLDAGLKLPFL
jgi:hypothetical protein